MTALDTEAPTVIQASRTVAGPHGSLTLDLSEIVQRLTRHVLYTVADVDHLDITITQAPSFTTAATIAKADLVGGHATYTFTNLPDGSIEVEIKAKDASGTVIGQDRHSMWLTANQTTSYAPSILLLPSVAAPAGGGGASTPTTNLAIGISLTDGMAAPEVTVLATVDIIGTHVAVDAAGRVWSDGYEFTDLNHNNKLFLAGPGSTIGGSAPLADPGVDSFYSPIRFDNTGRVLANTGNLWKRYTTAPAEDGLQSYSGIDVAVDGVGTVWYLQETLVGRQLVPGTPGSTTPYSFPVPPGPGHPHRIFVDSQGNLVLFRQAADNPDPTGLWQVDIVSPTGTVLHTYRRNPPYGNDNAHYFNHIDMDPQGNIWVLSPVDNRLFKLSPTLSVLAEAPVYDVALALDVDAAGKAWVLTANDPLTLMTRYDNDCHVEAMGSFPVLSNNPDGTSIAGDGHGNVWIPGYLGLKKFTF